MTFNAEQQALYDRVTSLGFSKLLVLGPGGTGKSYSLCKAISEVVRAGTKDVILCAPTHMARLNLLGKLDSDVQHLVETATVASLLQKFAIDREDGTKQFTQGKGDKIDDYTLIALDECSMISEEDYLLFMTSKAKVIFTGDMAQLPPVMAKSCETKMNSHTGTGNLEVMSLVKQMRQQGVIHAAAERNRQQVWFPEETEYGEGGEAIIVHNTDRDMVDTMISHIINDSRGYSAIHQYRYITYKNDQVRSVGKRVRDKALESYFGYDPSAIPFVVGEIIMMRENKKNIGYNGELVEVTSVKKDNRYGMYPWDTYELSLKGSLGTGVIRTIPPCQYPHMDGYMSALQSKLRKHQIAKELTSASAVLAEIKRIRAHWAMTQYPYAVTTHKSQGSTIENVYLNTLSFSRAPSRRALLYVGISRASKSLHTVKIPASLKLSGVEVNKEYRKTRAAYEDLTGESYRKVVRFLGISTGTWEGKKIATEYLQARIDDILQENE